VKKSFVLGIIVFLHLQSFCLASGTIYDFSFTSAGQDSCLLVFKYIGDIDPSVHLVNQNELVLSIQHCSGFSQAPPINLRHHRTIKKIQWQAIAEEFEISVTFQQSPNFRIRMSRTEITIHLWPPQDKSAAAPSPVIYFKNQNPGYTASFLPVPAFLQGKKNYSDTSACPVRLDDLAYVETTFWGTDDSVHQGSLIVDRRLAFDIMEIFEDLFQNKFPLKQMRLMKDFNGHDNLSMAANNTSAFNCRSSTGNKNHLSLHAYGLAVDINPLFNPYVNGKTILPQQGKKYKNRALKTKGMIHKGDVCHQAFTKRGWTWGGSWKHVKDYQHFEKNVE
jgi:hypothetical protein